MLNINEIQALNSEEIEKSVLGVMMINNEYYYQYANLLCEELFYTPKHARIFKAIKEQVEHDGSSDSSTLVAWIFRNPSSLNPEVPYIAEVSECGMITSTFAQNIAALREMWTRRCFREFSFKLQQASIDMSVPIPEIQKQVQRLLYFDEEGDKPKDKTLEQANDTLRQMIVEARSGGKSTNVFSTGFKKIDEVFAYATTELEVVAAESGVGKSILCINMAVNMARAGIPTYYISLEMRSEHLAARITAPMCKISASRVMKHPESLSSGELRALENAQNELKGIPLLFDESVKSSPLGIIRNIREKAKRGYKVFYVDFIQQLVQGMEDSSTEKALGNFARDLKNLAMELNICIIAVSQLNRDKLNPRPNKNRIRGSGQIVEAANSILFIWRPTTLGLSFSPKQDDEEHKAEIIVGKARDAGDASFFMGFDGQLTTFYDLDEQPLQKAVKTGFRKNRTENDIDNGTSDNSIYGQESLNANDPSLPF